MVSGTQRRLPYPLTYEADMVANTPENPAVVFQSLEDWPTANPDERIRVVFDLSLNEYVALASSVDVGRDIAYGENSVYIWWIWCRMVVALNICDDVADCIENSAAVQQALGAWFANQNSTNAAASMNAQRLEDMAAGLGASCDEDAWWGASLALVQRLNRANEDALEQLESATNPLDFASSVIGSVPVLDELGVDAILGWAEFLQDNIAENYLAQYTTAYEEEVACDLFCIALENCELTAEQMFDYFFARVGSSISWASLLQDVLGYLIGRTWSGTQIADFMMLSQIGFRRLLGRFTGDYLAFNDIAMSVRLGLNNPSSDWEIICDDCPEVWSFVGLIGDPMPDDTDYLFGTISMDNEAVVGELDGWRKAYVRFDFATDTTITYLSAQYQIEQTSPANFGQTVRGLLDSSQVAVAQDLGLPHGTPVTGTVEWEGEELVDAIEWRANGQSIANLLRVEVRGTGTRPPEFDDPA